MSGNEGEPIGAGINKEKIEALVVLGVMNEAGVSTLGQLDTLMQLRSDPNGKPRLGESLRVEAQKAANNSQG
jgi:hypothetical protein